MEIRMIKWLIKLPLFKQAYRQGGVDSFALAQKDILETMRDDLDKRAEEMAKDKLANLLSVVNPRSIVTLDKNSKSIYIGGKLAEDSRLLNLKSEAEALSEFDLWKILMETPKRLAEKAMFEDDGLLPNQLLKGRAILFTLDTQNKVIDILKSYSQKPMQ